MVLESHAMPNGATLVETAQGGMARVLEFRSKRADKPEVTRRYDRQPRVKNFIGTKHDILRATLVSMRRYKYRQRAKVGIVAILVLACLAVCVKWMPAIGLAGIVTTLVVATGKCLIINRAHRRQEEVLKSQWDRLLRS